MNFLWASAQLNTIDAASHWTVSHSARFAQAHLLNAQGCCVLSVNLRPLCPREHALSGKDLAWIQWCGVPTILGGMYRGDTTNQIFKISAFSNDTITAIIIPSNYIIMLYINLCVISGKMQWNKLCWTISLLSKPIAKNTKGGVAMVHHHMGGGPP